ncbi:MAG: SDR family oxidoreductase [Oscillatoria sp. PMC 1068.18]|nr:SDR family oxidoreductase [Oscillatoria sp. PMC 1076.18]MEC4990583.1 SDR family oxidoreductase [Oscillatoria sp. PMC 1068.18]
MDLELTGKTALVTASSKGIGKAIAQGLAMEGCQVIICSRDQSNLLKATQQIEAKIGQLITPLQVDLCQKNSIERFLEQITNKFSTIDILVNNTGGMPYKQHYELNQEDWQRSFDLTFMSQVNIAEALIPQMKKQSWGRIIFVTSVAAKQPGMLIAHSQRASVVAYAKTLANELGEHNILVNSICPSFTVTNKLYEVADELARRQRNTREQVIQQWMKSVPLRRLASAEEVANLAVFLASEKASYITGTCIQVDGGFVKSLF